ncbi:MAG: AAA family ATPase, partial [Tannerellaceae bacterium]
MTTTAINNRKLPIGIQSFEKLRRNDYLYVDKTALIYQLVSKGT